MTKGRKFTEIIPDKSKFSLESDIKVRIMFAVMGSKSPDRAMSVEQICEEIGFKNPDLIKDPDLVRRCADELVSNRNQVEYVKERVTRYLTRDNQGRYYYH